MKKTNLVVRLCAIVGVVSFIAFLFYYPHLPETVPTHWNAAGEVDNYGHKGIMLFFAALPLMIVALMAALPRLDPKRQNYARHQRAYNIFTLALTLVFTALGWVMALQVQNASLPVGRAIPVFMGILFIVLGNWMPQIKPNYFMGIRTPWALENETVWRKTHRAGGLLFVAFGVVLTLTALLPVSFSGTLAMGSVGALLAGCVGLFVYSYLVFKKLGTRKDDDHAEN